MQTVNTDIRSLKKKEKKTLKVSHFEYWKYKLLQQFLNVFASQILRSL